MTLADLLRVYEGSDGVVTKAMYAQLEAFGPIGVIAVNLFRASKCSKRAKVYRGHGYKDEAYARKQWSLDNLCHALDQNCRALELTWGWKEDPAQTFHRWVLYVDLPTGQVSFHTDRRGLGPVYEAEWDGVQDVQVSRILQWIAQVIERQAA